MSRIGRNTPCPCGSGRRYKQCCGALQDGGQQPSAREPAATGEYPADLRRAAAGGDPRALAQLGLAHLTAAGAPPDPARGIALIERAARAGDPLGSALAATVTGSSLWRERDWSTALDHELDAAARGHGASQGALRILAAGPCGEPDAREDWRHLRSVIDLDSWLSPPAAQIARTKPRIRIIERFAPPALCDWLIEQVRGRLNRATIYDRATGGTTIDKRRLNSQCDLGVENMGLLTFVLRARIAAITGRPEQAMEIPKILHYAPGETFTEHFDFLDPEEPAYAPELAQRGQRAETFLLYLNDDYEGGETHFPDIGFSHRGHVGDALLFANLDQAGEPDRDTRHAGLPPTSGEKWLFSQWIRALPPP